MKSPKLLLTLTRNLVIKIKTKVAKTPTWGTKTKELLKVLAIKMSKNFGDFFQVILALTRAFCFPSCKVTSKNLSPGKEIVVVVVVVLPANTASFVRVHPPSWVVLSLLNNRT